MRRKTAPRLHGARRRESSATAPVLSSSRPEGRPAWLTTRPPWPPGRAGLAVRQPRTQPAGRRRCLTDETRANAGRRARASARNVSCRKSPRLRINPGSYRLRPSSTSGRNGLADAVGPAVHFFRWQVGAAKGRGRGRAVRRNLCQFVQQLRFRQGSKRRRSNAAAKGKRTLHSAFSQTAPGPAPGLAGA